MICKNLGQPYELSVTIHIYLNQTNDYSLITNRNEVDYTNLMFPFCSIRVKPNKEHTFHQSINQLHLCSNEKLSYSDHFSLFGLKLQEEHVLTCKNNKKHRHVENGISYMNSL